MSLNYPIEWKYLPDDDAEPLDPALLQVLGQQVIQISNGATDKQSVIETFKEEFASIGGNSTSWSTSYEWAVRDLDEIMASAALNAATFIDAYWTGLKNVEITGLKCPTLAIVNKLLAKHGSIFEIRPPNLVKRGADAILGKNSETAVEKSDQLARYNLGEVIGQGGFGTVYHAIRKTSLGDFEFALKLLDPSPFVENREKATKRFAREIKALILLQHRGIVPYVDAGMDATGRHYVVMPLIRGRNIRDASEGLAHRAKCLLLVELLHALHYAHQSDTLHRDLKPSNIIVRDVDMQPIIVDFGNAYLFEDMDSKTLTTAAVGSLGYIPSEVLADPSKRTPQQDVYACGVITYEIFARRRPDPAAYRRLSDTAEELFLLDDVIQKALAPESSRYASAEEMRQAMMSVESAL